MEATLIRGLVVVTVGCGGWLTLSEIFTSTVLTSFFAGASIAVSLFRRVSTCLRGTGGTTGAGGSFTSSTFSGSSFNTLISSAHAEAALAALVGSISRDGWYPSTGSNVFSAMQLTIQSGVTIETELRFKPSSYFA